MKGIILHSLLAIILSAYILLHLCHRSYAAQPAAQINQQVEIEAKRIFPTLFIKCGDDYFSKRIVHGDANQYIIDEYKDLEIQIEEDRPSKLPFSKADILNGLEWEGRILFIASVTRHFNHRLKYSWEKQNTWTEWQQLSGSGLTMAAVAIPVKKKHGQLTINLTILDKDRTAVDCKDLPPH